MSWSFVLGRVALRTGIALWRQRVGLMVAGLAIVALGAVQLTVAGPTARSGDCADTAMAALTHGSDATARAAYACLDPTMRTTSEEQFVAALKQRAIGSGQVDRVADRTTPDGGKIVFYTVSRADLPAVGYIVYLDQQGKIVKVE
jgi:hypothetical protein